MDEVNRFYKAEDETSGTHLALRWKGRVRYTVPREAAGQESCWEVFRPGMLGIPLRAMARLPRLSGAITCMEGAQIACIREAIGKDAGLSCCRAGAAGPWLKDTILLLDKDTVKPQFLVKAGVGAEVGFLLQNEADWLRNLRNQATLAEHIPALVAHRSGEDLSFVAQRPVVGKFDFGFDEPHTTFLRHLQKFARQKMRLEESRLYRNLSLRLNNLHGLLTADWATRLETAMRRIEQSLSGEPIVLVAAHNDFTPWNLRVEQGFARVFDWEYADFEQLPLFDPLHFILLPLALKRSSTDKMVLKMQETARLWRQRAGTECCYEAETQALTYLVNLCTLYLWAERGKSDSNPVLDSYARIIDRIIGTIDPRLASASKPKTEQRGLSVQASQDRGELKRNN